MKPQSSFLSKITLLQWDIFCACGCIVFAAAAWFFLWPIAHTVISDVNKVSHDISFINKADSIGRMVTTTRLQAKMIDSLINTIVDTQTISEQAIPGAIYELAGKTGIKASKVEISGKAPAPIGARIPVSFKGEGTYEACGKFLEGLENIKPAGRVRELNMSRSANGIVSLFVDFVVLTQ
jgi:hypothetical protein